MKLHSFLSPKCEMREINGKKGVFALDNIKKGELIAVWGGIVYTKEEILEISKYYPHFATHPVSVYDGFYLGPINKTELDDVEYINHSCEPNAGIKGQIILVSRKNISPDEEICFDYETTETTAESFKCECGSKQCRKIINGNAWKDPNFQKENEGFLSWYIEQKIIDLRSF